MKHTKTNKRTLFASVVSLLLCISMLIGSTFAWFTDSASTGVNKIQAGTLDVVLEMWDGEKWVDAEGQTLRFDDKDDNELWEPGCTYTLQNIRVRNNGNLYLKYMIAITGIGGDAKLNEAVEWTANGQAMTALSADASLAPGTDSGAVTIQGHMKEEAGNEYQGLSIDNISITVYATQYTAEYDSNGNTYDKDATYPTIVNDLSVSADITGKVGADGKLTQEVVISGKGISVTLPVGTLVETGATKLTLKIEEDYVSNNVTLGITAGYDVTVEGVDAGNTAPIVIYMPEVMPKNQTAIQLFHEGTLMEQVDTVAAVSEANSQGTYGDRYFYDKATGDVTFAWTHFSNVSIGADSNVVVDGKTLTGFTTINLNEKTGDVTITSGQKVVLTWNSGEYQVNELTSNPIVAIFTNETPNPGTYFAYSILVESGATVVLNGVNIRTADGEDALQIQAAGGDTTTIYVADGTRNYLTGRSGIGIDGYSSGKSIVLAGGGFLQATATSSECPGIGPADQSDGCPSITIDVGHLRVHPGKNAAGIGGGFVGQSWRGFNSITIDGGIIQSYSGGNAAAIGSGRCGDTGSITINGGKIYCYNQPWTANHHAMGAGTYAGTCNSIRISSDAYIYASSYGVYDTENYIDTISRAGFKATNVEFGVQLGIPTPIVTELTNTNITMSSDYDGSDPVSATMDVGYAFATQDSTVQAQASPYRYWHAEFVVSADAYIPVGALTLTGQYDAWSENWIAITPTKAITEDSEIRLLSEALTELYNQSSPIYKNYEELCTQVKTFNCGMIANAPSALAGTTVTVELRLYETLSREESENDSVNEETGKYITIGTYSYTYPELETAAPVAEVKTLSNDQLTISMTTGSSPTTETMDVGYAFIATESKSEVYESPYKAWHADFVVSADKDIPANAVTLAGYYSAYCDEYTNGAWVGMSSDTVIPAANEIRLIQLLLEGKSWISYQGLCETVKEFDCGLIVDENKIEEGTTITVELRLYEASGNYTTETGDYIVIGVYTYTVQ